MSASNISASVRQRLLHRARETGVNFQVLLTRFALERLLYRCMESAASGRFVLKGAFLFLLWNEELHRMTRDLDLLGYGRPEVDELREVFRSVCAADVPEDGVTFDPESVSIREIRGQAVYDGYRVGLTAHIGSARLPLQIDIGFGDAVHPSPREEVFPGLLEFPEPIIHTYPRETVVAEKFHGIVRFGMANSRMKDYFDLWFLSEHFTFAGEELKKAISGTFRRRETDVPEETPLGLTDEFAGEPRKARQWDGFLQTIGREEPAAKLRAVIRSLQEFLMPPVEAARQETSFTRQWTPGDGWMNSQ